MTRPRVLIADIPDLEAVVRSLDWLTPAAAAQLDAIEQARYVLIKMDQGEYWRCGRCGGRHSVPDVGPVLTKFCTPRPWRGIGQGLFAYYRHLDVRDPDLSPEQRTRKDAIASSLPDLASRHPEAARRLGTRPGDLDYVGWLLGSVVEISEADARAYAGRINARAYRPIVRL